ncbi:uncharacterized protein B0I36DRAFT_388600 [Microdochium trichocladiopsis]|uniref:Uncharacterized protein n=1 Tax=Microdochium trichocladiopsis TaxID=1682393 RepID=A0A9P9BN19_9PEZI|nr:uncharacterized protein B0I36DRAFT_388600 [Microdochium trichocladiopsis]KAH7018377.1 hypothetical protein B0I36DRAFT_388600 [Microdochium trichocladiopsis]
MEAPSTPIRQVRRTAKLRGPQRIQSPVTPDEKPLRKANVETNASKPDANRIKRTRAQDDDSEGDYSDTRKRTRVVAKNLQGCTVDGDETHNHMQELDLMQGFPPISTVNDRLLIPASLIDISQHDGLPRQP